MIFNRNVVNTKFDFQIYISINDINRRLPVTICLWCLSAKGYLLHLHGRLSGFVKNKSKSRLLTNLLKLKNLVDTGGVSL